MRRQIAGAMNSPGRSTILVTGATGFLGRHVCAALLARGYRVRGLVRPESGAPEPGVEAIRTNGLHDRIAIREAVRGAMAVIHLAARVHVMRDRERDPLAAFRAVNVDGTRILLLESIAAGVDRFVFTSSVKAMGEANEMAWTEETPPRPVDPYGVSKLEAEAVVRQTAADAGLHAPILRFPLVYGPGMKGNMLRLFRAVDRGWPIPIVRVRNRRSLLFVGNAVDAVIACLETPAAGRETFLVSDGRDVSTIELVEAIGRVLGRRPRLVPIPYGALRAGGRLGDLIARVAPFPLTTAAVDRLTSSLTVDPRRIERVVGFRPAVTFEDGLRRTAEWYLSGRTAERTK